MAKREEVFLLTRYFNIGWLERAYFNGAEYCRPYSAEDRLRAGEMFYLDFLFWQKGVRLIRDYDSVKVDVSRVIGAGVPVSGSAERFRRALRLIPKASMAVVYKIVLNEEEIRPKKSMSAREKLYFNDEIKGLLCRGLDELCSFYAKKYV